MHYLNVIAVSSKTVPAFFIRLFTRSKYNHTAISIDENYESFYSFSRRNVNSPMDGGFVREKASFYSLGKEKDVDVLIYKVPITKENMLKLCDELNLIENDDEYIYNLFSAILSFIQKSHSTYKAYYCSEFVAYILDKYTKIKLEKDQSLYTPKDIVDLLSDYLWYSGPISKYASIAKGDDKFYNKLSFKGIIKGSFGIVKSLINRKNKM